MFAVSCRHTEAGIARIRRERRALPPPKETRRTIYLVKQTKPPILKEKAKDPEPYRPRVIQGAERTHPLEIIKMVSAWSGVTIDEIMGKRRLRKIVNARHDCIEAIDRNCRLQGERYSLPAIGRIMGMDHTSILHALDLRGVPRRAQK